MWWLLSTYTIMVQTNHELVYVRLQLDKAVSEIKPDVVGSVCESHRGWQAINDIYGIIGQASWTSVSVSLSCTYRYVTPQTLFK